MCCPFFRAALNSSGGRGDAVVAGREHAVAPELGELPFGQLGELLAEDLRRHAGGPLAFQPLSIAAVRVEMHLFLVQAPVGPLPPFAPGIIFFMFADLVFVG